MNIISNKVNILKEDVAFLHFPKDDVLFLKEDQLDRHNRLNDAITLGNIEHQKVKITFQDIEGVKQVETTVWAVTDKSIVLKKGVIMPIHRIESIELL